MPSIKEYRNMYDQLIDVIDPYLDEYKQIANRLEACDDAKVLIDESGCLNAIGNLNCEEFLKSIKPASIDNTIFGSISHAVSSGVEQRLENPDVTDVTPHIMSCVCEEAKDEIAHAIMKEVDEPNASFKYLLTIDRMLKEHGINDPSVADAINVVNGCNINIDDPSATEYIAATVNLSIDGHKLDPQKIEAIIGDAVKKEFEKSDTSISTEEIYKISKEAIETIKDEKVRDVIDNIVENIKENDKSASLDDGISI